MDSQWLLNNSDGFENYEANMYRVAPYGGIHDTWMPTPIRIYYNKCLFVSSVAWWIDRTGARLFELNNDDGTINFNCQAYHSQFAFILIISYT